MFCCTRFAYTIFPLLSLAPGDISGLADDVGMQFVKAPSPLIQEKTIMNSSRFLKTKLLVIFLGLMLGRTGLSAGEIPAIRLGFSEVAGYLALGDQAALLLTPEQISTLQDAWGKRLQSIGQIRSSGSEMTPEKQQQIKAIEEEFVKSRDEVLTAEQRDTIIQINDVAGGAFKATSGEFQPQIDAALTREEKFKLVAERNKVFTARFLTELKAALPTDRFAAFQAAQSK